MASPRLIRSSAASDAQSNAAINFVPKGIVVALPLLGERAGVRADQSFMASERHSRSLPVVHELGPGDAQIVPRQRRQSSQPRRMPPLVDEPGKAVQEQNQPQCPKRLGRPFAEPRNEDGASRSAQQAEQEQAAAMPAALFQMFSKGFPHGNQGSRSKAQGPRKLQTPSSNRGVVSSDPA